LQNRRFRLRQNKDVGGVINSAPVYADFGDWYSPGGQTPQAQDAFATPGARPNLGVELTVLDVIGYHLISSAPTLQSITLSSNGLSFAWITSPNQTYQIQYTKNLSMNSWSNLTGVLTASNATSSFMDSAASNSQRFYRVVLLP